MVYLAYENTSEIEGPGISRSLFYVAQELEHKKHVAKLAKRHNFCIGILNTQATFGEWASSETAM